MASDGSPNREDRVPLLDHLTEADGVPPGPGYSHAVTVSGRLAFVSGQVAVDAAGQLVAEGDMRAQVTQALRNLEGCSARSAAAGLTWPSSAGSCWT
jgi:enamine deaminase RidA (YjgF/YER057c/UK114 family)